MDIFQQKGKVCLIGCSTGLLVDVEGQVGYLLGGSGELHLEAVSCLAANLCYSLNVFGETVTRHSQTCHSRSSV